MVSSFLALKKFQTLFWYFCYWLWTDLVYGYMLIPLKTLSSKKPLLVHNIPSTVVGVPAHISGWLNSTGWVTGLLFKIRLDTWISFFKKKGSSNFIKKELTLREKCPNTEFFLVLIFPHLDWIRRDTEYTVKFSGWWVPIYRKCFHIPVVTF